MSKKNTILVTGGAGFVGSNLINYLLKKTSHHIISIDNYSSGFKKNHLKNLKIPKLTKEDGQSEKLEKKKINLDFDSI